MDRKHPNAIKNLIPLSKGRSKVDGGETSKEREAERLRRDDRGKMEPKQMVKRHQGDYGLPQLDGGLRAVTLDEQKDKRKQKGLCPTCGEVRTHKPGLWRSLIPDTVNGLVYKGICLACNTLDAAKMQLCEPIDGAKNPLAGYDNGLRDPTSFRGAAAPRPRHTIQQRQSTATADDSGNDSTGGEGTPTPHRSSPDAEGASRGHGLRSAFEPTARGGGGGAPPAEVAPQNPQDPSSTDPRGAARPGPGGAIPPDPEPTVAPRAARRIRANDYHGSATSFGDFHASGTDWGTVVTQHTMRTVRTIPASAKKNVDVTLQTTSAIPASTTKRNVEHFRCRDFHEKSGFYTGTINGENLPQGRGEMVYDDGEIARGVWSNGILKVRIAPISERYEPYVLSGYNVGDKARREDMLATSREETAAAVPRLHVGDCAWVRRSDGTWSYALVEFHSDGDDAHGKKGASVAFRVNARGSTKTISARQWGGHVRLPARPDVHPGYSIGDPGRDEDMIVRSRAETARSVSKMRINDGCFVKRSGGSWGYSVVKDRDYSGDDPTITFQVNERGSTKVMPLSQCGKFVRRIRHK